MHRKNLKKELAVVMTAACLFGGFYSAGFSVKAEEADRVAMTEAVKPDVGEMDRLSGETGGVDVAAAQSEIRVNTPSKRDIAIYFRDHDIFHTYQTSYAELPSTEAPYVLGSLSESTLNEAVSLMNAVRYVAGIDANVTLNEEYNQLAQAAALVNGANGAGLSHSPDRPDGMSEDLYKLGYEGAGSSNISAGYRNFYNNIINGWMADADSSNISRVGHRRWILNPTMKQTGFGMVPASSAYYGTYSAMYAFDNWSASTDYCGVAWPARNMPEEFFADSYPWSISMGYTVKRDAVRVEVTDLETGQLWELYNGSSDGYFNVENSNYGQKGCIIFRPDGISCNDGKKYQVSVTGTNEDFSYTVDFFSVKDYEIGMPYDGNINSELIAFDMLQADNGAYYLAGQIVVVEWVDVDGDGERESTVPEAAPKMTFKSTDGEEEIDVFVTPTGTNTYYFDRFIEGLSADKEYVFEIASTDERNISANKSMNVSLATSPLMVPIKNLGKIGSQKISYYKADNGELRLYPRRGSYVGNINSQLMGVELVTGPNGNYVSGEIVVVEWEDGISTVPFETPIMYFNSTDGAETLPVWVTPTGTNTYYFDRSLGDLDTNKEYIFTIESGDSMNISPYKSMVVTTYDMTEKEGTLWETESQYVRYRTNAATGQLRVYGVNR